MRKGFFMICSFLIPALASAGGPDSASPLNILEVGEPKLIGESRWGDGQDVIVEREYYLQNGEEEIYAKRKFRIISPSEWQLIWKSPSSRKLDERYCAFQGGVPLTVENKITVSPSVVYNVTCTGEARRPGANKKQHQSWVAPMDIIVGDQYLLWDNADTVVQGGVNAIFQMRMDYSFNGSGSAWFTSEADAAAYPPCTVAVSVNYTSYGTHSGYLHDWRRCYTTTEPGTYAVTAQGCAGSLCDTQAFTTTVVQ